MEQTGQPQKVILINESGDIINPCKKSNGCGKAGLALSILGVIFCWVPILGWAFMPLAFLFSFIGVFRSPRGQAIAGLIISGIALLLVAICMEVSMELLEELTY